MKCLRTLPWLLLIFAGGAGHDSLNVGRELAPTTGPTRALGDMPMALAPSPDGKFMLVLEMGYRDALRAIPIGEGKSRSIDLPSVAPKSRAPVSPEESDAEAPADPKKTNGLYYGLVTSSDGHVYAAQGAHDSVAVFTISGDGALARAGEIRARAHDFPAGLALDAGGRLFVVNNAAGYVPYARRQPASVAIYDIATQKELGRYSFASIDNTSTFPLAVQVTRDGKTAYISGERDGVVYVIDSHDVEHPTLARSIPTGAHPTALLLNRAQDRLYVANSLSDTVSVIDTHTLAVVGTALLRPDVVRGLVGAAPTALALSPNEKTLYVALGDMNAVGVVDAESLTLTGMLPVGWYPSAVQSLPDARLLVLNAKGSVAHHPNPRYTLWNGSKTSKNDYILNLLTGTVQMLNPAGVDLHATTDAVMAGARLDRPLPVDRAALGPVAGAIKHVIYIVKENRTYDQVLGDDPRGNGDPSLVLFGKDVTPNLHAIADRFVLLDNCYACGEVSGDGWVWSTQGAANAYVERNLPYQYSGRGRTFDYEGENNDVPTGGFPATDPDGKPLSQDPHFRGGAPVIADVGSTGTHLWDIARAAGLSIRNYGFFLSNGKTRAGMQITPDNYPTVQGLQPPGHDLAGITDIDFRKFDLDYADSDAPSLLFAQSKNVNCVFKTKTYGKYNAPSRFAEWNREFQQMLAKDATGSAVPALMLVRLPHDHTQGLSAKKHTPRSEVADNDYGVGQLVQAVSESPIWSSTAIFIIEDDAQSGPDHVDAHRTTAYAISPWIKRGSIDHRFYNTDSVLKTIELLLNLKPMSQYDAIANPFADFDARASNIEPFKSTMPDIRWIADIQGEREPEAGGNSHDAQVQKLADASEKMDFEHADAAPAAELNDVIWKSIKGADAVMPPPRNTLPFPAAGPKAVKKDDDD